MPDRSTSTFLRQLRGLLRREDISEASDGRLLQQFLRSRDEGAFAEIVRRHGAMVLAVCRRFPDRREDSEDVFQAAFLLLIQRGRTISRCDSVAGWLHGVAYRCALKTRTSAARRRVREHAHEPPSPADGEGEWRDVRHVLDEEIDRLPARYRTAFLLCCVQERSFQDVSQELRWPLGTVATRVARAKELLRARLSRRGVTVTGSVLAAFAAVSSADAASMTLTQQTAHLAQEMTTATKAAGLRPEVTQLMKGAQKAMFLRMMRRCLCAGLACLLTAAAAAVFLQQTLAARHADNAQAPAIEVVPVPVPLPGAPAPEPAQKEQPDPKPKEEPVKITVELPKEAPALIPVNVGYYRPKVVFENTSKENLVLWPYLRMKVYDDKGVEVPVSKGLGKGPPDPGSPLERVPFKTLKPGEKMILEVMIGNYSHDPDMLVGWTLPKAGDYTLKFSYHYDRAEVKKQLGKGAKNIDAADALWNKAHEIKKELTVKLKVQ